MIATGHTAVGVIAGITAYSFLGQGDLVSGLVIAGVCGAVSHYVVDFIPHGHFFAADKLKAHLGQIIIFDLFLPITLFLGGIYFKHGLSALLLYTMFGIGGAQLPDVLDGLIYTKVIRAKGLLKVENSFHQATHWHGTGSKTLLLGLRDVWQILVILAAVLLVALY